MIEALHAYLSFLDNPPRDGTERLGALAERLDRLAIAYHETADVEANDIIESPAADYKDLRKILTPRFPELGLYAVISPGPPNGLEAIEGDAIDDLIGIASDLMRVDWLAKNGHTNEAIWEFRFAFEIHWGRHLMDLRSHIYRLRFNF